MKEKWYKLAYASRDSEADVNEISFDTWDELCEMVHHVLNIDNIKEKFDRVYLLSFGGYENPPIISPNPIHISKQYDPKDKSLKGSNSGFRNHHLFECSSYEEAFSLALMIVEPHYLCYE